MMDLICAGRIVPEAEDRVRRYCGARWSGGGPEVWAYPYFDRVASPDPMVVDPIDVLSCAALHPGLSRGDLEFFLRRAPDLAVWLERAPQEAGLASASEAEIEHVAALADLADGVSLSLLSKVMHRKRPSLVPLLDKDVIDWYRPLTGLRGVAAWPLIVANLRNDLDDGRNRSTLKGIRARLTEMIGEDAPSDLRMMDIAIWMGRIS